MRNPTLLLSAEYLAPLRQSTEFLAHFLRHLLSRYAVTYHYEAQLKMFLLDPAAGRPTNRSASSNLHHIRLRSDPLPVRKCVRSENDRIRLAPPAACPEELKFPTLFCFPLMELRVAGSRVAFSVIDFVPPRCFGHRGRLLPLRPAAPAPAPAPAPPSPSSGVGRASVAVKTGAIASRWPAATRSARSAMAAPGSRADLAISGARQRAHFNSPVGHKSGKPTDHRSDPPLATCAIMVRIWKVRLRRFKDSYKRDFEHGVILHY